MVSRHCNLIQGTFTCFIQNCQIYTRHIEAARELLHRNSVNCSPYIWLNPDKKNFYDFTIDDIKIKDYPIDKIKSINPQINTFRDEIAI